MARELNHSCLALPSIKALKRKHCNVEVWDNPPEGDQPPHVSLITPHDDLWDAVDLTPSEARALAALLINAADSQEKAAARPSQPGGRDE